MHTHKADDIVALVTVRIFKDTFVTVKRFANTFPGSALVLEVFASSIQRELNMVSAIDLNSVPERGGSAHVPKFCCRQCLGCFLGVRSGASRAARLRPISLQM